MARALALLPHRLFPPCSQAPLALIRGLGLHTTLNGPPWLLPDPILSEAFVFYPIPRPDLARHGRKRKAWELFRSLKAVLRVAGGRARIAPSVRWA